MSSLTGLLSHPASEATTNPYEPSREPVEAAVVAGGTGLVRDGETLSVGPWLVRLQDVTPAVGPNWTAIEAELRASRGGGVRVLKPQTRFFTDPMTETNEAAIQTVLGGQLYTVIGKSDGAGRWQLRLWWKPLVTLIWLGGAMIAFGGLLALLGRALRGWRPGRRERYA